MISRAGKRALRPSLLWGANGASFRPMRGPRGGKGPPRRGDEGAPRAAIAARRPLALVAEERRKAPLHVRLVVAAQRFVGDFSDRLAEAPLERRALFGRVETLAVGFAHEQHVGERPRAL